MGRVFQVGVQVPRRAVGVYFNGCALISHLILHSKIAFNAYCFKQSHGEL